MSIFIESTPDIKSDDLNKSFNCIYEQLNLLNINVTNMSKYVSDCISNNTNALNFLTKIITDMESEQSKKRTYKPRAKPKPKPKSETAAAESDSEPVINPGVEPELAPDTEPELAPDTEPEKKKRSRKKNV